MNALAIQYKRFQDWFAQRAPRERILLMGAGLSLVISVLYMLVIGPQLTEQQRLREQAATVKEQNESIRQQLSEFERSYGNVLSESGHARTEALRAQLAAMDPALAEVARAMVSPREMAGLVEQVLRRNRALEVITVENLPSIPLSDAPPPADPAPVDGETEVAAGTDSGFYKHGMVIEVRGRYADIVSYLRALEAMPWKVFWGQVTLIAEDYPKSRVRLVVYTLSLNPNWIGI